MKRKRSSKKVFIDYREFSAGSDDERVSILSGNASFDKKGLESLQDRSKNHSNTVGVSGGGSIDGGLNSAGANANMSSGNKKWVTEQTSLTGGVVDIYVENKTTLAGAVIASTHSAGSGQAGDLTLDTGSLEYSHIKDRNNSTNFGGGASAHSGNGKTGNEKTEGGKGLDSASFGFSDSRQTNFATIGEGTIIVRDGNTDLSKLNRDETKAQYGTMDAGVQLSADKGTIDLLTSPIDTFDNTMKSLDQIKDRAIKIEEQTQIVEKTGNWIEYDHFATDTNPLVQTARITSQIDYEGIDRSTTDLIIQEGGVIKRDDGQVYQVVSDKAGRLQLVDTGFNENRDTEEVYHIESPKDTQNNPLGQAYGIEVKPSEYGFGADVSRFFKSIIPTEDKKSRENAGGPQGDYGENRSGGDFTNFIWLGGDEERGKMADRMTIAVYSNVYGISYSDGDSIRVGKDVPYKLVQERIDSIYNIIVPSLRMGSNTPVYMNSDGYLNNFLNKPENEQILIDKAVKDVLQENEPYYDEYKVIRINK